MAAQALLRLYHYSGNEDYLKKVEKTLRLYYDSMEKQPFGFAHMLAALDFYLEKPKEIVLVAARSDPATQEILTQLHSTYCPNQTLQVVEPGEPLEKISLLLKGKAQIDGKPTVYVCHNFTCSPPATEWEEIKAMLEG